MDHTQFKTNQTAAVYVADGLDAGTQEAFELHMMDCSECVSDVESWRAIRVELPNALPAARPAPGARRSLAFSDWRMAASLFGAGVVGAAGGWAGKSALTADFTATHTIVFNVPAVSRGAECSVVQLASDTRLAVLRVPGVARGLRVVALDAEQQELPAAGYSSRVQPDGSQLVQIDAQLLNGREVRLEARRADGSGEPVGCVTGQVSSPEPNS
ncbi:MAG TPA: hypothetical protein VIY54_11590 [Steroidobacteraceae bacterium]